MAFRSRKLAKALALAVPFSSFVFPQQVFCVIEQWALGDTECFDDKKSIRLTIIPFETKKIYGFFDPNTKFLCIDGVEINEDIFKNINVVPVKDIQSISIGKDVIFRPLAFKDFISLKSITIENRRLNAQLIKNKLCKVVNKALIQNIDDLIQVSHPQRQIYNTFCFHHTLKKVIINKNVNKIGEYAFFRYKSL